MSQSPKPIVLIVEDESLIRMLEVDAFADVGFEVLEAEHAAEARDVNPATVRVRLLFTDVNMPGEMNGIDLSGRLVAPRPRRQLATQAVGAVDTYRSHMMMAAMVTTARKFLAVFS